MHFLTLIFLAGVFASADFLTGRDWKHWGWPTRSIYVVGPALMVVLLVYGYFTKHMLAWPALGFGWACYRSVLGWSSFGGSVDVQNTRQGLGELIRNLVSCIFVALPLRTIAGPLSAAGVMIGFSLAATAIAVWYGYRVRRGHDVGVQADIARGVTFGVLVWLVA